MIRIKMMRNTTGNSHDDPKLAEAELAEELALHQALKRIRLEEAAKRPVFSVYDWIVSGLLWGGWVWFFHEDLARGLWFIIPYLALQIHRSSQAVHTRIDAILELQGLEDQKRDDAGRNKVP